MNPNTARQPLQSLNQTHQDQRISDILLRQTQFVWVDNSVAAAAARMRAAQVGALPVLDEHDRAVGIVTERDIVQKVIANARHPEDVPTREAMTPKFFYCDSAVTLSEAARIMIENEVRLLLVLEEGSGRAIGVISLDDLIVHMKPLLAARTIRAISRCME